MSKSDEERKKGMGGKRASGRQKGRLRHVVALALSGGEFTHVKQTH